MLPTEVMQKVQKDFLDFNGLGCSVIEISHRSKPFIDLLNETITIFNEITNLPKNKKILFMHGGARTQFASIPLNLLNLKPSQKAGYILSGLFAENSYIEAQKFGTMDIISSSKEEKYRKIPTIPDINLDEYSYIHYTGNNTVYGTQWKEIPNLPNCNLVMDATSDILTRKFDYSKVGLVYGALQKNLGPSGLSIVVIDEEYLNKSEAKTPLMLDYTIAAKTNSLINTINTFAIYVTNLTLKWVLEKGGVDAMEKANITKSDALYDYIDSTDFYKPMCDKESRSIVNITFNLSDPKLEESFLEKAEENNLIGLKGHVHAGGIRASMYNAMPIEGTERLIKFLEDFRKAN